MVRANVTHLKDAADWARVANGPVTPVIEEPDFIAEAAALLPEGPFDGATWGAWTGAVKEKTGRKGKQLFMPLRLALTGRRAGRTWPTSPPHRPGGGAGTARRLTRAGAHETPRRRQSAPRRGI